MNKILGIILGTLICFIGISSALFLFNKPKETPAPYRKADPEPQSVINKSWTTDDKLDAYTRLNQIRILLKSKEDEGISVLVVEPWFSYPQGDTVLYEELCQKERKIKAMINEYFAAKTASEINSLGEESVKAELLELINKDLVLGKIRKVYFNEYLFLN